MQRCIHLRIVSCFPKELLEIKKGDDVIYFSQRYWLLEFNFTPLLVFVRHQPSGLTLSKQKLISSSYLLVIKNLHATMSFSEVVRNIRKPSGNYYPLVYTKTVDIVFRALRLATQTRDIQCFSPPSEPKLATSKWLPGLLSYIKQTKKFHKKTKKLFPTTGRRQRNSVWQFFITGKALSV